MIWKCNYYYRKRNRNQEFEPNSKIQNKLPLPHRPHTADVRLAGVFVPYQSLPILSCWFIYSGRNIKEKWSRFTSNKVAVLFVGIWLLHLVGMLWTSDFANGIKDLRIKLPLLLCQ